MHSQLWSPVEAAGLIDVLKINMTEFEALCRAHLGAESSQLALVERAVAFAGKCRITTLALTDGPRPAFLLTRNGATDGWAAWQLAVPALEVVSAIGAGDTVAAGLVLGLLGGLEPVAAFRYVPLLLLCATSTHSTFLHACMPIATATDGQAGPRCRSRVVSERHARRLPRRRPARLVFALASAARDPRRGIIAYSRHNRLVELGIVANSSQRWREALARQLWLAPQAWQRQAEETQGLGVCGRRKE